MDGSDPCGPCACGCDGYASPFDERAAEDDLRRYRRSGPDPTTATLLEMIEAEARPGMTLLDIGGGIGVIDQELLGTVASRAVLVDASPASLAVAAREARAADLGGRLEVVAADFVRRAEQIAPADIVTLDRVVCCYPDVVALVSASAARARVLYGLVLPRDHWWVRGILAIENVYWRLRGHRYRAFGHPHALIESLVESEGLHRRAEASTFYWRVVLFARDDASQASGSIRQAVAAS